MAAITQPKKSNFDFPIAFWLLLALTILGVGLAIYRMIVGLGVATNLSDHYPWGIWITIDLFIIPFAGAAFTISLISYFLGRDDYHSIIRPAVLAGFLGYGVVGVLLFLDLGRWPQFYNIFVPKYINLHSFLEEVSLCVTLYTLILVLEIAPIFLEKWGYKVPIKWLDRSIFVIAGAGIVLSILHQSSLGSMFLLMSHKLHPLWWTPALPLLFYLQAVYTGLSAAAIAISLIWRALKLPIDRVLFRRIGQAMSINLMLYAAIKVGDWMGAGEIPLLLKPDAFGYLALFQFAIGIVLPLIILLSKLVGHSSGPFWAGVFALIGTFIERLVVSWIGLAEPNPVSYIPSFTEIFSTIGIIAGGVLVYMLVARYFKLFPDSEHSHA
jgi:Ni/Fe-hydrogenase subunit HybB-like protein